MIMLCSTLLSGCETAQTRPAGSPDYPASVTADHRKLIEDRKIGIGFTPLEVELAWGTPAYRRVSDDATKQIWYYTRIIQDQHYVTVKKTNPHTGLDEYVEEPYKVQREIIVRTVYFEEDLVVRWKLYPAGNVGIKQDTTGTEPE